MKKEIKVAIITGDAVENMFESIGKVVYPLESKGDIKDVLDLVEASLEDGEDEKLSIQIKYVSKSWYEKLKEAE